MQRPDPLEQNPDAGKDWRQEEKGTTEDEIVEWHHWLNGVTSGVGDGQGNLGCCHPWDHKESDMTERLNWTDAPYSCVYNSEHPGSIPGLGRSPGEGNGTHCSILAWKIPWMEDLVGYSLWDRNESDTTDQLHSPFLSDVVAPGNLDSSLCFIQPGISHDVLCI